MSRADSLGLFWQDITKERLKKVATKRTPPPRTWEDPSYLPYFEEAERFDIELMSDEEVMACATNGDMLVYDCEVYPNYYLAAFVSLATGKYVLFEIYEDWHADFDADKLKWVMENCCTIGFNTINYDNVITALALSYKTNIQLKLASDQIIVEGWRPYDVLKAYRCPKLIVNNIDLIQVAPLAASLKTYGGRLHTKRMQDLPFRPDRPLTENQRIVTRWYGLNDLRTTTDLYYHLQEQIALRSEMSAMYKVDLRSKSDAQIAETVISSAVTKMNGCRTIRPEIAAGTAFRYRVPYYMEFKSNLMNGVLETVRNSLFVINEKGSCGLPKEISSLDLRIGSTEYRMGIGGLHSMEKKISHWAGDNFELHDVDVVSYYPKIILNQGLFPEQMGQAFLKQYSKIVYRRIDAKKAGNKVLADALKITINGTFGKTANKFSSMYSPQMTIQTTVSGQLSLLMLIEALEWVGLPVVSANTDGIVVKCPKGKTGEMWEIIRKWERTTNFETESTQYTSLHSKDVNNYLAFKPDGTVKGKGAYANPWSDKKLHSFELHINPSTMICVEAVCDYIVKQVPVEDTIAASREVKKFVSVRNVQGGAVKDGEYLGKAIRWYYSKGMEGEIVYARSGNKVPKSEGAKPLMDLPDTLPDDINYEWYVNEAKRILVDIGL